MSNQIEGIPDGWELVRIGNVRHGEFYLDGNAHPVKWNSAITSEYANYSIVRKIEKPKRYRPFANAAEFEPHRLRWWKTNGNDRVNPPAYYNDSYHGGLSFDMCFTSRTFDDGTPFGIEVTE